MAGADIQDWKARSVSEVVLGDGFDRLDCRRMRARDVYHIHEISDRATITGIPLAVVEREWDTLFRGAQKRTQKIGRKAGVPATFFGIGADRVEISQRQYLDARGAGNVVKNPLKEKPGPGVGIGRINDGVLIDLPRRGIAVDRGRATAICRRC